MATRPSLDQFASLRQDTDLAFLLMYVDAKIVYGWPLLSAALTACTLGEAFYVAT